MSVFFKILILKQCKLFYLDGNINFKHPVIKPECGDVIHCVSDLIPVIHEYLYRVMVRISWKQESVILEVEDLTWLFFISSLSLQTVMPV